ncbi:MAG: beta-N-acetylhexosaminidase [Desulfobacterales bacterium]|nr:beta-N-acetylhexosaminidase [Desulfobacterales bacterium]
MNIDNFSDEQLAGQRLMVGFDGVEFNAELAHLIETIKVGGIILFARNLSSPERIAALCHSLQECAAAAGQPPLFISIDQEGGIVARLKAPFTLFSGNPSMKEESDAIEFARVTASELKSVGINMNLAPVMDVAPAGESSVMEGRVFGHDPEWVSRMGVTVIREMQANGIMAVAKHFPGIGRTHLDSHEELPTLEAARDEMESFEFPPFRAAVEGGVAGVMTSHILYPGLDPDWPATLSPRIIEDVLRKNMGYDGVVMTDDLDMGAIRKHHDIKTVIGQVLSATVDLALICHKGPDIETAFREILKRRRESGEERARGAESIRRIMALKRNYLENDKAP